VDLISVKDKKIQILDYNQVVYQPWHSHQGHYTRCKTRGGPVDTNFAIESEIQPLGENDFNQLAMLQSAGFSLYSYIGFANHKPRLDNNIAVTLQHLKLRIGFC